MPWSTPSLRQVRIMVRDDVTAALSGAVLIGNSVLRVMSDAMAALAHLTMRYVDWGVQQMLPDTAEKEFLDRHGDIWLVNSDNSLGRKSATYSQGTFSVTGTTGGVIPQFSTLLAASALGFETTEAITVSESQTAEVDVRALQPGSASNLEVGTQVSFSPIVTGVAASGSVVEMYGGTDDEADDDLRSRVLARIRNPPMGGDAKDYELWATAVAGVTRAWCAANEQGIGTITVRFMMDDLHPELDGFPTAADVVTVTNYLDAVRPVAIKDLYVEVPIAEPINFTVSNLNPDTPAVWAALIASVQAMLRTKAAPAHTVNGVTQPAQTIYAVWVSTAISETPGVISFDLTMSDAVMPYPGALAVFGTATHA